MNKNKTKKCNSVSELFSMVLFGQALSLLRRDAKIEKAVQTEN